MSETPKEHTIKRSLNAAVAAWYPAFSPAVAGHADLEGLIKRLVERFPEPNDRIVEYDGKSYESRGVLPVKDGGVSLHLTAYSPGDKINAITHGQKTDYTNLVSPPENTDFIEGELMVYVRGNHVIYCSFGIREGRLASYLWLLAKKAKIPQADFQFQVKHRVLIDKLATIQREGVKSIKLSGVAHSKNLKVAAEKAVPETLMTRITGSAVQEIKAFFEKSGRTIPSLENALVDVVFRFDAKKTPNLQGELQALAEARLSETEDASDDDSFVIETMMGNKFKESDTRIHKEYEFTKYGKSANFKLVSEKMREYFGEIAEASGDGKS